MRDFHQPVFWALLSLMLTVIKELPIFLVLMLCEQTVDIPRAAVLQLLLVLLDYLSLLTSHLLLDLFLIHDVLTLLLIWLMSTATLEHPCSVLYFLIQVLPIYLSILSLQQPLGDLFLDPLGEKKKDWTVVLEISYTALEVHNGSINQEGLEDTPRETPESLLIISQVFQRLALMPLKYCLCLLVLFHELNKHLAAIFGVLLADIIFVCSVGHHCHSVLLTYLVLAVHGFNQVFP